MGDFAEYFIFCYSTFLFLQEDAFMGSAVRELCGMARGGFHSSASAKVELCRKLTFHKDAVVIH